MTEDSWGEGEGLSIKQTENGKTSLRKEGTTMCRERGGDMAPRKVSFPLRKHGEKDKDEDECAA